MFEVDVKKHDRGEKGRMEEKGRDQLGFGALMREINFPRVDVEIINYD